jgi:DNA topoisomerase-1
MIDEVIIYHNLSMVKKYPIRRIRNSNGSHPFKYIWNDGKSVTDKDILSRIRKLGIPPAYTKVKINNSMAKIQAIGLDDKKRKQYRYHPSWITERNRKKFRGLISFAQAYPKIIRNINNDISKKLTEKKQIVALAIGLINICRIRPGSTKHLRDTGSFGTTTLLKGHVSKGKCPGTKNDCLLIAFKGKSGVINYCKVTLNTKVGKALKKVLATKKNKKDPIFTYKNSLISPEDINKYLQKIGGRQVTAKAFRTYHANARFINALLPSIKDTIKLSLTKRKKHTVDIIKKLAEELHHTPATFKNSYLFPPLRELVIENPENFKKNFYKKNVDDALINFINKKTSKSPQTPKIWR